MTRDALPYIIVVPSMALPLTQTKWAVYHPTWVEWSITAGAYPSLLIGWLSWLAGTVLGFPLGLGLNNAVGQAFLNTVPAYKFSVAGVLLWLTIVTSAGGRGQLLAGVECVAHRGARRAGV